MAEHRDATEFIRSVMPLCDTMGVTALAYGPAAVVLAMPWRADLCTSGGILHGGALMALADAAGAAAAVASLPDGAAGTSTIESKTNFLGSVPDGEVVATARPLHIGSTTIVIETELRNGDRLVAKTTQTQVVLRPR